MTEIMVGHRLCHARLRLGKKYRGQEIPRGSRCLCRDPCRPPRFREWVQQCRSGWTGWQLSSSGPGGSSSSHLGRTECVRSKVARTSDGQCQFEQQCQAQPHHTSGSHHYRVSAQRSAMGADVNSSSNNGVHDEQSLCHIAILVAHGYLLLDRDGHDSK